MKKQTVFDNWAGGVITSMKSDALPNPVSPRGRNSILASLAGGQAVAAKRSGFEILNPTPVSGRPAIIGQTEYIRNVAGTKTFTHVLVGDDGSLQKLVADTASDIDAADPTPFTSGPHFPQFATMNDLLFIVNGTDRKKLNNSTVQNFGIERPAAPMAAASVAGNPNGTYEFAISYFNSSTGHESSRSDLVSQAVVNQKITITWTAPADPQVDYIYLHVRKPSLQSEFFRLVIGVTPAVSGNGAFGITDDPIEVDVTDAELTALTLLSPDTVENEPPPEGLVSAAVHLSRLFVADKTQIYYSKAKFPEAFDPEAFEPVNPADGQDNVAVGSYFERLVIWKEGSVHALYGSDENSWVVDSVDPSIGCISAASIRYYKGYLYWWSKIGPVRWNGTGVIEQIGQDYIAPTISREVLNHERLNQVCTEVDSDKGTVLFSVPETGQERNTLVLPWNAKAQTWDSDGWNPFDIASMTVVRDGNGKPWVVVGNYAGRMFRYGSADTDGAITDSAFLLSGNVASATSTTLTAVVAIGIGEPRFDVADDGLKELYVYATSPDGVVERRRIESNTETELTVTPAWNNTPDDGYTFAVAAPHWQWDTKWESNGLPFHKKRGLRLFSQMLSSTGTATIRVEVFKDFDLYNPVKSFTFVASGTGGIFDVSLFDQAVFGDLGITNNRHPVGKRFRAYRVRYSNLEPNVTVALHTTSMKVSIQSEKT